MTASEAEALLPVAISLIEQVIALVKGAHDGSLSVTDAMNALAKLQQSLTADDAAADTALDEKFK